MKTISIVTPLYRSERFIEEFYRQHLAQLTSLNISYEFIFVNDGSPDQSRARVLEIIGRDENVKLLTLSRNFGQQAAIFAGLAESAGEFVYIADCDPEEPADSLPTFFEILKKEKDVDVVYGVANPSNLGFWRRNFRAAFYVILNSISEVEVPRNQCWQRVMRRGYVEAILQYSETETIAAGLFFLAGFNQVAVEIQKRDKGSSSYTFYRRLKLAVNSFVTYSSKPLIAIGFVGLGITTLSFASIAFILFRKLVYQDIAPGWASVICSIWGVGGLILSSIGITGMYLSKVYNQVKRRPPYLIKSIEGQKLQPAAVRIREKRSLSK